MLIGKKMTIESIIYFKNNNIAFLVLLRKKIKEEFRNFELFSFLISLLLNLPHLHSKNKGVNVSVSVTVKNLS